MGERRIITVDERLCHQRDNRLDYSAVSKLVSQCVLEHEADRTLRVADRITDRHRGHLPIRDLGSAQDETDLRPVAVRHHDIPAGRDHVDHVRRSRAYGSVLIVERGVLVVADQRVATHCDDDDRVAHVRSRAACTLRASSSNCSVARNKLPSFVNVPTCIS